MPDMMEAFGTVRTGMDSSRALMTRSVCVVALQRKWLAKAMDDQHIEV